MSISYQGKALDTYSGSYHRAIADKSFVVMNEVAMQCSAPLEYQSYYFEKVPDNIDYQCNAENSGRKPGDLPFSFPGWDEKLYSPVCRSWYLK
jgi:hypothetical protein